MKIEEVIQLYDFLANCSMLGIMGIWFIVTLIVTAAALWGKDKWSLTTLTLRWIASILIGLSVLAVILLFKHEATERKLVLQMANCIKSEYVMYGFKVVSIEDIKNDFHCSSCTGDSIITDNNLRELLEKHANEFVSVKTDDEKKGIRIIDPNAIAAIDKYNHEHLPFIKTRILSYLKNNQDSISYADIRKNIEKFFDDEWIELMVSKYDSLFIPWNSQDSTISYSKSHGVQLQQSLKVSNRQRHIHRKDSASK